MALKRHSNHDKFSWRTIKGSHPNLPLSLGFLWLLSASWVLADSSPSVTNAVTPPTPLGTITTDATSRTRIANSVADVVVGIQADGRDIATVSRLLEQHSQTLLDYLRQQDTERLRTEEVTFDPQTDTGRNGRDHIVGYTGHLSVSFRTTPEKLSTLLGGSLEHGANTITLTSLVPREAEIDSARQELAIGATKAALAQADAVAKAAEAHVVRIEQISLVPEVEIEPFAPAEKPENFPAAPRAVARTIATSAGERELAVRVIVRVAIEK